MDEAFVKLGILEVDNGDFLKCDGDLESFHLSEGCFVGRRGCGNNGFELRFPDEFYNK